MALFPLIWCRAPRAVLASLHLTSTSAPPCARLCQCGRRTGPWWPPTASTVSVAKLLQTPRAIDKCFVTSSCNCNSELQPCVSNESHVRGIVPQNLALDCRDGQSNPCRLQPKLGERHSLRMVAALCLSQGFNSVDFCQAVLILLTCPRMHIELSLVGMQLQTFETAQGPTHVFAAQTQVGKCEAT